MECILAMARQFSILGWDGENQVYGIVEKWYGFNQDFSKPHEVNHIALVKWENELLVYALDDVEALTKLRQYLVEYKPNALLIGYFNKPTLKG